MAAAFAALVSLKNNLDLIQNHPRHSFTFEPKQIQSLWETVSFLIDFLKSCNYRKEAAEALEKRIARAAEAAEDVVETHVVDQIRSGKTRRSKTGSSRFLLDLQKVTQDLDFIRRKATTIELRSGVEAEQQPAYSAAAAAATSSTSNNSASATTMVGFDGLLLQLLDQLTGSGRRVIPIVGMGGIGKTFLTRNAFQHPLIVQHFDICLWATISQQYKDEKILSELVSGLRTFTSKYSAESTGYRNLNEGLDEELYKGLCGQRYLIILDDMWSVEAWNEIRFLFPDKDNGSRIVVTTRHSNVASQLSISWLAIRILNEFNSWNLFCQKVFSGKGCPPKLEEIGKKIVGKCRGLPLAIVVAGGHLRNSSMALEYWENVANHMSSVLNSAENEEEEQCLNILSLSYSYLPPHLKPCFLLIGAFPEDENISGRFIRKLWISEGFIEPVESKSLEEVAQDYLQDLYERNLILVDYLGFNENVENFRQHDLLRELCIKIGEKEEFLLVGDSIRAINRERRLVFNGKVAKANHQVKTFDAPIRCLMYEGGWPSYDLKLLRTLNRAVPASMGVSIFQQVNLRLLKVYLEKKALHTFYLPSSISMLWNLQTLTIDLETSLSKVIAPYEIWEMLQLRHLEIFPICLVDPLPAGRLDERNDYLVMKNLQTLWKVENFRLSEEVCRRIPNVTELHVLYCNEASSYYCPQNLCYLDKVEFFICDFHGNGNWRNFALSLTFPSSIKWLFLSGCRVDWEEMTMMVGSLPHLISLRLSKYSVIGSVWTTVEGKFPSLKNLEIWECDELVHLNVESSHFPVLQNFSLLALSNLEEIPTDIGDIPTLQWIFMTYCSNSSNISAIRIMVEQEEQGNEDLGARISLRGDEETLKTFNEQIQEENLTCKNLFLDLQLVKP